MLIYLISSALCLVAQEPPTTGLRVWFDAEDLDADPATTNPAAGAPVSSWADKVGGALLEQIDPRLQPSLDQLALGAAVLFNDDFLIAPDITHDPAVALADDDHGSIVTIFSRTKNQEGNVAFIGAQFDTVIFPHLGSGFGLTSPSDYVFAAGSTNNGSLHYSIVNSDAAAWDFFLDGIATEATAHVGSNSGRWFADFADPTFMSLAQFTFADGSMDNCCPHFGHIAELLIYDHPLDTLERAAIASYVNLKYGEVLPLPRPPTGLIATPGAGTIALDWDDNPLEDDVLGYDVFRSETMGGPYEELTLDLVFLSEFVDENPTEGIVYSYVVTATNQNGSGLPSEEGSAGLPMLCELAPPEAPSVPGLRFWLDASDIGVTPGQSVTAWTDKKCGITLDPGDPLNPPRMATIGSTNAPAVLFDNQQLIANNVALEWYADLQGSVVTVFTSTSAGEGHLLSVGGNGEEMATVTFQGLGAGFAFATNDHFVMDTSLTNDGWPHFSIVNADAVAWDFFVDGFQSTPIILDGANTGEWWGRLSAPTFVSLGQFPDLMTGVPPQICCPFFGHIAEIMIFDDFLDNDCDGLVDGFDEDCFPCAPTEVTEVTCDDGIDNDCDDTIDDADQDCICLPTEATEVTCDDGVDNDCDNTIDDADQDCICVPTETTEITSDDGIDNDCDNTMDDADQDYICVPTEATEVTCDDGIDNDCDDTIDDSDQDCICVPTEATEVTCDDGIDNDCDGAIDDAIDDADQDCICVPTEVTEATCDDGIDNDCDGDSDSADVDCAEEGAPTNEFQITTAVPKIDRLQAELPVGGVLVPLDVPLAFASNGLLDCRRQCAVGDSFLAVRKATLRFQKRSGGWQYRIALVGLQEPISIKISGEVSAATASVSYKGPLGKMKDSALPVRLSVPVQTESKVTLTAVIDAKGKISGNGTIESGLGVGDSDAGLLSGTLKQTRRGEKMSFALRVRETKRQVTFRGVRRDGVFVGRLKYTIAPARGRVDDFEVPDFLGAP